MAKRPAFQFYPSDHRSETGLQLSSLAARGLWTEMLCVMHEGNPYGHLVTANGQRIDVPQLARLVGETPGTIRKLLDELEANQVFSREEDGTIYSRRMVRDEHIRTVRAEAGRQGGNPQLTKRTKRSSDGSNLLNQQDKQRSKQKPTPSSSPSSSSSKEEPPNPLARQGGTGGEGVFLSEEWTPTAEHVALAAQLGVDLEAREAEFREFIAENGGHSRDLNARFRGFLRRGVGRSSGGGEPDGVEMSAAAIAAWESLG